MGPGPSGISGAIGSQLVRVTKTNCNDRGGGVIVRVTNPTRNDYQNVNEYARY